VSASAATACIRSATIAQLKFGFMVSSSIMARQRPGIVGHPHDETQRPRWTPAQRFSVPNGALATGRQDAPGGGAQDGSRFSRNAAIPSAASAEANSAWETSVARVNAGSRSIPGIV